MGGTEEFDILKDKQRLSDFTCTSVGIPPDEYGHDQAEEWLEFATI
jgi:hypothetical protein